MTNGPIQFSPPTKRCPCCQLSSQYKVGLTRRARDGHGGGYLAVEFEPGDWRVFPADAAELRCLAEQLIHVADLADNNNEFARITAESGF